MEFHYPAETRQPSRVGIQASEPNWSARLIHAHHQIDMGGRDVRARSAQQQGVYEGQASCGAQAQIYCKAPTNIGQQESEEAAQLAAGPDARIAAGEPGFAQDASQRGASHQLVVFAARREFAADHVLGYVCVEDGVEEKKTVLMPDLQLARTQTQTEAALLAVGEKPHPGLRKSIAFAPAKIEASRSSRTAAIELGQGQPDWIGSEMRTPPTDQAAGQQLHQFPVA